MKLVQDLRKIFKTDARSVLLLTFIACAALIAILIAFYFAYQRSALDNRTDIERISESPSGYTTIDGKSFVFDASTHRLTVVTTWATWCSLCTSHLLALSTVASESGDDIAFIAVNRKEQKEVIDAYVREVTLPDGLIYVLDPEDFLLKATNGFTVPETILYDSSGKEVRRVREPLTIDTARVFVHSETHQ